MEEFDLARFVRESNRIEGIHRPPTPQELRAYIAFLSLTEITTGDLIDLVKVIAPAAVIRDRAGLDVRVGSFVPTEGGPHVREELALVLLDANSGKDDAAKAHRLHHNYETLHPFTDGNGRSGRALWLWMMGGVQAAPLGFLHTWYYQSLRADRE